MRLAGRRWWRGAAALAALAWACAAAAAPPRVAIAPIAGKPAAALVRQLEERVCSTFECVPWARVSTRGQPDFEKARRLDVGGLLVGTVAVRDGRRTLRLALLTGGLEPAQVWPLALGQRGTIVDVSLRVLMEDLDFRLNAPPPARPVPAPAPPPPTVTAPPAASPPAPPPAVTAPPSIQAPAPASIRPVPLPPPPTPRAAAPSTRSDGPARAATDPRWTLAGELGVTLLRRELRYSGQGPSTGALRDHSAPGIVAPRLHLELLPLARTAGPALAGVQLFADYEASLGLKTQTDSGEKRPSTYSRLGAGAGWRSPPLTALRLVLSPALSYQSLRLAVSPPIAGLPDARLSGIEASLGLELPVAPAASLLLGLGYVRWTTARDLVAGAVPFFPGGSASALELEGGLSVALWGPLSLRLLGQYGSTRYRLDADPTVTYAASGATDTYLGGRLVVRGRY